MRSPVHAFGAVIGLSAALLAACGDSSSAGPATAGAGGRSKVPVVASTNVYGDIAEQIGGDRVKVTSIISNPEQDPHSYQVDTRTRLELSRAKVVIENGGGYDDFVDVMLKTARNPAADVLDVVGISGKTAPAGGDLNEHVWYDLPTVERLADRIAESLAKATPADGERFTRNAAAFKARLRPLEDKVAAIRSAHGGAAVAITEPVPGYLLQACGLRNRTPADFSEAIEEGDDVSPKTLRDTLALFTGGQVKALVFNRQTSGPETDQVERAAKSNGVPVVPVTETLPAGKDYVGWMTDNLNALQDAL